MKIDKASLMCDLAETYHIYNYKELPCTMVALFSCGLREESRIKKKLSGVNASREEMLLASIADSLSTLVWLKTKDGVKGINRPKSFVETLLEVKQEDNSEVVAFDTADDFCSQWKAITEWKGESNGN